jgi:hypothetical protein
MADIPSSNPPASRGFAGDPYAHANDNTAPVSRPARVAPDDAIRVIRAGTILNSVGAKPVKKKVPSGNDSMADFSFGRQPNPVRGHPGIVMMDEMISSAYLPQGVPAPALQVRAPEPARPSLKSFIASGQDIEGSVWTVDMIADGLIHENWRIREVGETMKENDLLMYSSAPADIVYERTMGYKDQVLTQEMLELNGMSVYTLEGGGKPRKPVVIHATTEYEGLMSVPRGVLVAMPTDENEARRFFGCEVIITETIDKGKPVKVFYPVPTKMANRPFRRAFSRVFPEFARRVLREHIKKLIHGRGEGLKLKKKVSTRAILRLYQPRRKDDPKKGLTVEEISNKLNLPVDTVREVIARQDYQRKDTSLSTFKDRMDARALTPVAFMYDKSLGIEIETVTPVNHEKAATLVPSFVRCGQDGSIRGMDGNNPDQRNWFGIEYRLLIKRSDMEGRIVRAVESISKMGAKVNKSCGLHVHFDMRDKTEDQVVALREHMVKWFRHLMELLPASRRDNQYCRLENPDRAHWAGISVDSYKKHKTIEVRLHSATLNPIKIIRWIQLIETVMAASFTPPGKPSVADTLKMLNLSEADRTFWLKRHQQLNPQLYKDGKIDLTFLGDKAVDEVE